MMVEDKGLNDSRSPENQKGWQPRGEKAMAYHSCVLAWRIPGAGEPGGLTSMGSHRVGHN